MLITKHLIINIFSYIVIIHILQSCVNFVILMDEHINIQYEFIDILLLIISIEFQYKYSIQTTLVTSVHNLIICSSLIHFPFFYVCFYIIYHISTIIIIYMTLDLRIKYLFISNQTALSWTHWPQRYWSEGILYQFVASTAWWHHVLTI